MERRIICTALTFVCAIGLANAQTKNVFYDSAQGGLSQPIGLAFDPYINALLVTQPFCGTPVAGGSTGYQLKAINASGTVTTFANLPNQGPAGFGHTGIECYENHVVVSTGLGGFKAGDVFVTQGQRVVKISGGVVTPAFANIPGITDTHTGIAFDTVGTFCNRMIITGQNGLIYLVDSLGNAQQYSALTSAISTTTQVAVESAAVNPPGGTYGGYLLITGEDSSGPGGPLIAAIPPPTSCPATGAVGVPILGTTPIRIADQPSPEMGRIVPTKLCDFGSSTRGGAFFSMTYKTADLNSYQIVAYPAADFGGMANDLIVINEDLPGTEARDDRILTHQTVGVGNKVGVVGFDPNANLTIKWVQQEDATFSSCPAISGCTLTIGGYKNHFNYKVVPLTIGGILYSAADVTKIVGLNGGGINALARQLAAAKLNIIYGASAPQSVLDAIAQADAVIKAATADVGKTIFTGSIANSSLTDILDKYNNGNAPGGPPHCDE